MVTRQFVGSLLLLTFALTCAGCSNRLPTYPVTGKVQFENGGPVVVGMVELQSIEHSVNARGDIQPDGTFTPVSYTHLTLPTICSV